MWRVYGNGMHVSILVHFASSELINAIRELLRLQVDQGNRSQISGNLISHFAQVRTKITKCNDVGEWTLICNQLKF